MYKNPKKKERGICCNFFVVITESYLFFWVVWFLPIKRVFISDHGGSLMQPRTSSSRLDEEPGKRRA